MSSQSEKIDLGSVIEKFRPDLRPFEDIYRDIHKHPEVSCKEARTASLVAEHLERLKFATHRDIGGHGVVGVLKNGVGRTVMLRSELDALPIKEETGVPYASESHMVDEFDNLVPVMHACGHDMHMSCLLAAAELLVLAKSHWSGTLLALFQPNEEHTGGAQAMVDGGLYNKVPIPDVVLGQHSVSLRTGTVNIRPGPILTAADTFKIRIFGTSPSAANPQKNINPISIACYIVVRLQSIVNSEIPPSEFAVVDCEQIHAGGPGFDYIQHADLQLDVKSYKPEIREKLHQAIRRIVEAECKAAGITKPPDISFTVRAPLTSNDPDTVKPLKANFQAYFKGNAGDGEPRTPCEDFSILATSQGKPYAYWYFGTVDAETWDKARREGNVFQAIPGNHSPHYIPTIQPTLKTGVDAMALGALTFLT